MDNLNKNIPEDVFLAMKMLKSANSNIIFCGSIGLVVNGVLDRKVGDIDVITPENYWTGGGFMNNLRVSSVNEHSHQFMLGKDTVLCFKLSVNEVKVDVFYNNGAKPEFEEIEVMGETFKIETPESALKVKLDYVVNDGLQGSAIKHLKDLIIAGVDRKKIVDAMNRSVIFGAGSVVDDGSDIDFSDIAY